MKDRQIAIGAQLPEFGALPAADGRKYSVDDFLGAKVLVVVFSCNHCPYVQAYEERMVAFQKEYAPRGVRLVAVNANESEHYPEDNLAEMVKRAKARGFNFPYLRDEDQSVAASFGATHTPEFFAFAREASGGAFRLAYSGKMDDNHQNSSAVKRRYLEEAVDAMLGGKPVKEPETYSIGCTIKWK